MNKKLFSTLLIGALSIGSIYAQSRAAGADRAKSSAKSMNHLFSQNRTAAVNDTLNPSVEPGCDVGPYLLGADLGGFLSGTNGYGDLEKAQYIATSTSGTIHSILVAFGGKVIVGTPDNYNAKVYNGNPNIGPMLQMGTTSVSVSSSNIDTSGALTQFSFNTPIAYNGGFFASVIVDGPGKNDSIGILHTDDECGGFGAWDRWDDGSWNSFEDGWELDPALYIFAEVEKAPMGVDNNRLIERGSHKVFPNPSKGETTLTYSLLKAAEVEISLTDLTGKVVSIKKLGYQNQGLNGYMFNTQNFANGIYLYTIKAGNQRLTGKFVVNK